MALTKEDILGRKRTPPTPVPVPEWGGEVFVKTLSGTEREAYEDAVFDDTGKFAASHPWAQLLIRTLCDASGKLLFAEKELDALSEEDSPILVRLYRVAKKQNRLGTDEEDALVGESQGGPGDNSSSSSV